MQTEGSLTDTRRPTAVASSLDGADGIASTSFDRLARLAARTLGVPFSLISVAGGARHTVLGGFASPSSPLSCKGSEFDGGICPYVRRSGEMLAIGNVQRDERFRDDPVVAELGVAAYAGVPLRGADGQVWGVLCVADTTARDWTADELETLRDIAASAATEFDLRHQVRETTFAETARRESEARFRAVVESMGEGLLLTDRSGRIVFVNSRMAELTGYSAEEMAGDAATELLLPAEERACLEHRRHPRLAGESGSYEIQHVRKDGSQIWVEVTSAPFRNSIGEIVGTLGVVNDITERRSSAQELQIQKTALEQLFENAPEAIVLLDTEGCILRINPEFTRLFGFSPEEALHRRLDTLIVGEEEQAEAVLITDGVRNGRTVGTESVRRHKDGTPVHVSILGTPIRVGGSDIAVYGIYRDISDRKEAEARLAEAEAHYRRLVEASPYAIYALDLEGRFSAVNPAGAHILDCPAEALLGRHFNDIIAPQDLPLAWRAWEATANGESAVRELEIQVVRPSGEHRRVHLLFNSVTEDDRRVGFQAVGQDVTNQRIRDAQLRRADRLASIGTLVGGMAHELNNPLTSIKSFAELMLLDERPEDDRESLGIIYEEAVRAAATIGDLRRLAQQVHEGSLESKEPVDLGEVARGVVRLCRSLIESQHIRIREQFTADLPAASAVAAQLEQVILNLVLNAEQALRTHSGDKEMIIRTGARAGGVFVEVADNGPGIPTEEQEHIFDPFWTPSNNGEGTGLGLSLVHSIVTDHGGEVLLESEPGRGASFRVTLPTVGLTEKHERPSLLSHSACARSLRVLVASADASLRESLVRYLEHCGHHAEGSASGAETLERLYDDDRNADFDVIVADPRTAGLTATELLEPLRWRKGGIEERVLFLSTATVRASRTPPTDRNPLALPPTDLEALTRQVEQHAMSAPQANAAA